MLTILPRPAIPTSVANNVRPTLPRPRRRLLPACSDGSITPRIGKDAPIITPLELPRICVDDALVARVNFGVCLRSGARHVSGLFARTMPLALM